MRLLTPLVGILATFALAFASSASAVAQSSGDEVVTVVPSNVASNQAGVELQLIAEDGDFFGQAAGRAPELHVGDGVHVVEFFVESPKMARAVVDVDEFAFGAIPMQVWVYGLDGETVVLLAETSLGVTGPVGQGPLTLSVSENRRLLPDISGPQQAGDIVIEGPITGSFSLSAPQGTGFSSAAPPTVTTETSGVSVSEANVSGDESSFSFTIDNPETTQAQIRIEELNLDLASFSASGGEPGELAFGLSTMLMPGQSIPISSAHTPGRTISNPDAELVGSENGEDPEGEDPEGEDPNGTDGDDSDMDVPEEETNGDEDTTPPVTGGGGGGVIRSGGSGSGSGTSSSGSSSSGTGDDSSSSPGSAAQDSGGSQTNPQQQQRRQNLNQQRDDSASGGRGGGGNVGRGGGRDSADSDNRRSGADRRRGRRSGGESRRRGGSNDDDRGRSPNLSEGGSRGADGDASGERENPFETTPAPTVETEDGAEASGRIVDKDDDGEQSVEAHVFRFTVCDESFRPLPALGFQPASENGEENGRLVARVWLELVFDRDPTPGRQSEITIQLTVPGTEPKRVRLVETDEDSGVFRSAAEGVELTLRHPSVD